MSTQNTHHAVIVATPPHSHVLQFIAAMEKKLDCYCEKPLAYDIHSSISREHELRFRH